MSELHLICWPTNPLVGFFSSLLRLFIDSRFILSLILVPSPSFCIAVYSIFFVSYLFS
ncbi:unnamed protein product [Brassica oleracea]